MIFLSFDNRDVLFDVKTIYPPQLKVSNTNNASHRKCSFLDIDIEIVDGKFVNKVYDKRRELNFDILGLPSFLSNVPYKLYTIYCTFFTIL